MSLLACSLVQRLQPRFDHCDKRCCFCNAVVVVVMFFLCGNAVVVVIMLLLLWQ